MTEVARSNPLGDLIFTKLIVCLFLAGEVDKIRVYDMNAFCVSRLRVWQCCSVSDNRQDRQSRFERLMGPRARVGANMQLWCQG